MLLVHALKRYLARAPGSQGYNTVDMRRGVLSALLELSASKERRFGFSGTPSRGSPVFLHGGWRCGSTYIWSRFRQSPHALCRGTPSSWNSRHPQLDRPYHDEYLPLLGLRGVRGYHDHFAVARYFPWTDSLAPEVRYLSGLLDNAARAGKCAVFGFSRSLARAATLKAALGGFHVVLRRDPVQQWLSCRSYRIAEGSVYFELCHFMILALAPPGSAASHFAQSLGLPRPPPGSFKQQFEFLKRALGAWSDEFSFRAFLGVTLLSYATASTHADLTIDVDHLSRAPQYREVVRRAIFSRTALAVDFDECRLGIHHPAQAALNYEALARDVAQVLRSCGAPAPPSCGSWSTAQSAATGT